MCRPLICARRRQGRRRRGAISQPLYQAIQEALRDGGQVILLLNRRGYSTTIQCPDCGHVVKCPDCDITLTHHREGEKAACHYCEYVIPAPPKCPECGFDAIRYSGMGTQKLEAEIHARFPDVPCLRMDSDSMAKPGSHEQALDRFRSGEVKILVGTQMIAKGLDFPNVTLVGVINADTALHFPDFRAAERTFQLVTQVAGRTGRGERGGRVVVQTYSPDHPAILAAQRHDYIMFANQELPVRREFGYPPCWQWSESWCVGRSKRRWSSSLAHLVEPAPARGGQDRGHAPHPRARGGTDSTTARPFSLSRAALSCPTRGFAGHRTAGHQCAQFTRRCHLDRRCRSARHALTRSSPRVPVAEQKAALVPDPHCP